MAKNSPVRHSIANAPEPVERATTASRKHVSDLKPFRQQVRRHTPRNIAMIGDSLQEVGAARSIVIDEEDEILAGAGTTEAAAERGLTNVRVIEADGTELIAIRRRGLTPVQKLKLALYDNRAADLAEYDLAAMREALKTPGVDPKNFFNDAELRTLEDRQLAHDLKKTADGGEKETVPAIPEGFTAFSMVLSNDAHAEIRMTLEGIRERAGLKTLADALLAICRAYEKSRTEKTPDDDRPAGS